MNKKFYITTPIYYPSSNFHIGHCYTTVVADSIARYKKLQGYDVFFQTGTDEHGQKLEKKAMEKGVTPLEYIDPIVNNAKDLWKSLDIEYDCFIRTTDKQHELIVQKIFKKLYDQGDIYKGEYKGLYCVPCESFWTESQLIDGKCPDCNRDVHEVSEEAYFFKLSKYQKDLEKYIEDHPEFIQPISRKNEMINNFIKPGLEDLCVSRTSFKWGIPVDFDQAHVIYVWIDALTNYITSLGYLTTDEELFNRYWPADLQLVGKEIVRFHVIIWPILLMALGLPISKQVFAHGWLIIDGGKISKSLGNYEDPREYIKLYGVDAVRYFLLREVPFGSDGNFSVEALINRTNADLANTLGNLVNRTIAMANKYFDGKIENTKSYEEIDNELNKLKLNLKAKVEINIKNLEINIALENIFEVLRRANKYVDETEPWILYKSEKLVRLETVIFNLLDAIKICSILLQAFIPETCNKIFDQLGVIERDFDSINKEISFQVKEPEVLFKRIEN